MTRELVGWLYDTAVCTVRPARDGVALSFHSDGLDRWGTGSPVLSVALPLAVPDPKPSRATAFVEGLLPEGEARSLLASRAGISATDTFAMLERYGRDVAGAVCFLEPGVEPSGTAWAYRDLRADEVAAMLRDVAQVPLGNSEAGDSKSLAGYQDKVLLARQPGAPGWLKPLRGAPSTHILKPPNPRFPDLVWEEHFAMALAHRAGLDAEAAGVETIGDSAVLVVERYDRAGTWPPRRVHQEDMVQALGLLPARKYQRYGGAVTLKAIARLVPRDDLPTLLADVTFMCAVGDADQHGKNLSLLHGADGTIRLAPLYDLAPTSHYPGYDNRLALNVGGTEHVNAVRSADIVREAVGWGLGESTASTAVTTVLESVSEALKRVDDADLGELPPAVRRTVADRVRSLLTGRPAGAAV